MLTNLKYIPKAKIDKWWGKGFTSAVAITDQEHAVDYVSKYMSNLIKTPEHYDGTRSFGCSRNIPADRGSPWVWMGNQNAEDMIHNNVKIV
jgi:hypothetical protein